MGKYTRHQGPKTTKIVNESGLGFINSCVLARRVYLYYLKHKMKFTLFLNKKKKNTALFDFMNTGTFPVKLLMLHLSLGSVIENHKFLTSCWFISFVHLTEVLFLTVTLSSDKNIVIILHVYMYMQ